MALNKEFKIKVSVETDGGKDFKKVGASGKNLEQIIANLEKTLALIAPALEAAQKESMMLATSFKKAGTESQALNTSLVVGNTTLREQVEIQKTLADKVNITVDTFGDLLGVFHIITSPDFIAKTANLLYIFGTLAKVKGFGAIGDELKLASEKVKEFGEISAKVVSQADDNFTGLAKTAKEISVFHSLFNFAGLSAGAYGLYKAFGPLIGQFVSYGKVVEATTKGLEFLGVNQKQIIAVSETATTLWGKAAKTFQFGAAGGKAAAESASVSITKMGSNFVHLFDTVHIVGPALIGLGTIMQESESKVTRLSGKALILAGLLAVSLVAGVVYVTEALGGFAMHIGDKLIASMEMFTAKAQEMALATANFQFILKGFGREIGETATGTLEYWNTTMDALVANTSNTRKEIMKSVSFLITEGTSLGLSVEENSAILARAADIAAAKGEELQAVTSAILNALTGNSQALFNMGIDIRDVALAHSDYIMAAGKTVEQLTDLEKQQGRFNLLMKKSAGLVGAAANQLNTTSGAYASIEKNIDRIKIKLGEQGVVTALLIKTQAKLISTFLDLPDAVLHVAGTLQDFGGVVLKVGGFIFKYVFWILTVANVYKFLGFAVTNYTIVQTALNILFGVTASALGVQVVAVTSLATAWANLTVIGRGVATSFTGILLTALQALWTATVRLVSIITPFAVKLGIIVAVAYAFAAAFRELYAESKTFRNVVDSLSSTLDFLSGSTANASNEAGIFSKAWKKILTAALEVFTVFKDLAKLFLIGLAQAGNSVALTFLYIRKAMSSGDEARGFALAIAEVNKNMMELEGLSLNAMSTILDVGASSAQAAEGIKATTDSVKLLGGAAHDTAEEIDRMVKANLSNFNIQNEAARVLGTEFEKAALKQAEALTEVAKATELNARGGEKSKAIADAIKVAYLAELDVQKLRIDTLKDFATKENSLAVERLKNSGDAVGALKLEFKEQMRLFDLQVKGMEKLGSLSDKQVSDINRTRSAMIAANATAILEEQRKKLKEILDVIAGIKNENQSLDAAIRAMGGSQYDIINDTLNAEIEKLDEKRKQLVVERKLTTEVDKQLIQKEKLLRLKAKKDIEQIGVAKVIPQAQLDNVRGAIGGGFADGVDEFAGAVNGALSGVVAAVSSMMDMANGVLDAVQKLIDFIPQILNKIAGVINSITDLPLKISEAINNVLKSMVKLIAEFIPNIFNAIGDILKNVVEFLLNGLGDAFDKLFSEIPHILMEFLNTLPDLAENFVAAIIDLMPRIAISFTEMLIMHAPRIALKMAEVFAIRLPIAIIKGIVKGVHLILKQIRDAFSNVFLGMKIPKAFEDIPDLIAKGAKSLIKNISKDTSQLFAVKDLEDSIKKLDAGQKIQDAIDEATNRLAAIWKTILEKLMAIINYIRNVFMTFVAFLKSVWDNIILALTMVYESFANVFTNFIYLLQNIVSAFRNMFAYAANVLTTAIGGLKAFAAEAVNFGINMFRGFRDAAANVGTLFTDMGKSIWTGLKDAINSSTDGLLSVFDKLNPANLFEKMFRIDYQGTGTVEKALGIDIPFANFAKGGFVGGNTTVPGDSLINDKILALLSPDEAVIPRSIMSRPGMKELIARILSGSLDLPQFGFGGVVGEAVGGAQDTAGGIGGAVSQAGKDAFGSAQEAGKVISDVAKNAGGVISEEYKQAVSWLAQFDPTQLWKRVKEETFGMVMKMFDANKFHGGGMIGGSGEVPMTGMAGEFVVNRKATAQNLGALQNLNAGGSMGGGGVVIQKIEINAKTNLDADGIRREILPILDKHLKRRSQDGEFVLSTKGVR